MAEDISTSPTKKTPPSSPRAFSMAQPLNYEELTNCNC